MQVDLVDTTAEKINAALLEARRRAGAGAVGVVLTLLVIGDDEVPDVAIDAATQTAAEHPSRIIVVIRHRGGGAPRLDAQIQPRGQRGPGEMVCLDLYGELADHAESPVLPLLVPDTPVVAYWPAQVPEVPARDALGRLAQRRITDLAPSLEPINGLVTRANCYAPGDTDLSWTRVTLWRSMLAAALDQPHAKITGGLVGAEPDSPSGELLALWLEARLGVDVRRETSDGPGITEARLETPDGAIALVRRDGRLATLYSPGWPARPVALKRRDLSELLSEELRRLDPDDIYAEVLAHASTRAAG